MRDSASLSGSTNVVGLGVGSTNSRAKRWPAERFAELCDRLSETGSKVLLMGSEADRDVSQLVAAQARFKPIDLCGITSLEEAAAILSQLDLFVSNDMGLAHLAPAVGTQTVVIFGPTNPETTRPFSDLATVIREPVECSPCMLRDCPIDHRCMTRIGVDQVFEIAKSRLSGEGDYYMKKPAIFVDRDGTLIEEVEFPLPASRTFFL